LSRPFIVRPEAEQDLADAFAWYEGQAAGLGDEFLRSVDAAFALIQRHAAAYPVIYQDVRRGLVRRFPYGVFYVADVERTVVLAVSHMSQDPRTWPRSGP